MAKGIIKINHEIYLNDWDVICIIFKNFRPTHIVFRHWENDMWYFYGESEMFEALKEGEKIPEYDVQFNIVEGQETTYGFERIE